MGVISMAVGRKKAENKIKVSGVKSLSDLTDNVKYLRTGIGELDFNIMGMPYGSIVQIAAKQGVGKTTFVVHIMVSCLRFVPQKKKVLFIDFEGRLNLSMVRKLMKFYNIKNDRFDYYKPMDGQDGLAKMEEAMRDDDYVLLAGDSLKSVIDEKDIGKKITENMGAMADQKLVANFLRKNLNEFATLPKVMIWIDHLKESKTMGQMYAKNDTKSGTTVKFYASLIMFMGRCGSVIKKTINCVEHKIWCPVSYNVEKSTVCPNVKVSDIPLYFGKGVSVYGYLLKTGIKYGFIENKPFKGKVEEKKTAVLLPDTTKKKKGAKKSTFHGRELTYINLEGKRCLIGTDASSRKAWCVKNNLTLLRELEDRCYKQAFSDFKEQRDNPIDPDMEEF